MTITNAEIKRVVMIRLNPGEDILGALQEAVKKEKIKSGIILNGLGSAQSYRYHVVADKKLPPLEAFPAGDQPKDIVSYSGLIIDGRVHAHICLTDSNKAEGGHLEPGTKVLTFTMIFIADVGDEISLSNWDNWEYM